jgi:hypothetical protein
MLVKTKIQSLFFGIIFAAILFSACNNPLGMGDPIDWEAPVLTLDPVPNPLYVKEWNEENGTGITLTGKVTDNVGVTSIKFTNTATGEDIFPADPSEIGSEKYKKYYPIVINGNDWSIKLKFVKENPDKDKYEIVVENGEKIVVEIRAYDKMNNSDGNSVAIVTMIVDIGPPKVGNITIQRTDTRIARLEQLYTLKALETTDKHGDKKDELYKYQNGWFYISGVVNDEETKIDVISLDIYDVRDINHLLISLPVDENYTYYFPRWTVKEEKIIEAGKAKWGEDYKTNYYKKDGDRYYYRIVIKAIDMSENPNEVNITIEEDEGYMCLWAKSDEPKGIFDNAIAPNGTVSRGTPLPVDFFDDDSLLWAYTGLLTEEQWYGTELIYTGKYIPVGTDDEKLAWLKDYLRDGGTVYNWEYDKHNNALPSPDKMKIEELIKGKNLDEKLEYVATGKGEFDYGNYVLFTLAADKKLAPHDGKGPEWTNTNTWTGRIFDIAVIDENAPLIVFDTSTKDENGDPKPYCPEENTFPALTGGEFFNIVGYTLRENASGNNKVVKFRMAWIPYYMPDLPDKPKGADGYIKMVQESLSKNFANMPAGVQFWEFTESNDPGTVEFKDNGDELIETSVFKKQSFIKKMSVLGSADDIKPTTFNFMYDYKKTDTETGKDILGKDGKPDLENETKLFVFYAVDTMGHEVFRQMRLLGNKTPPDLAIYDISNYLDNSIFMSAIYNPSTDIPDPNNSKYVTNGAFDVNKYYPDLNAYNATKYTTIKGVIGTNVGGVIVPSQLDRTIPFQIYPRGTIVKYWINAENSGDIAVDKITMKDITYSSKGDDVGSAYNMANRDITFCEYYPDVTQRTFLFEATDKLGNVARIQRTVAVTNAAKLENITTTSQSGTYGIGQKITLQANFSSQVYVTGGVPHLNIRYSRNGAYWYETIPCTNSPMPYNAATSTSVLEFEFTVKENDGGNNDTIIIETLYDDTDTPAVPPFSPPGGNKRPIILTGGVKILDANRNDSAFIPGYQNESVTMPNWTSKKNSLQEKKSITLDGIRPRVISVKAEGKAKVNNDYYFKSGETLEFTLDANEDIRAIGTPYLKYLLLNSTGAFIEQPEDIFIYQRPNGKDSVVFSLSIDKIQSDGRISSVSLVSTSGIVDNAGNAVDQNSVDALVALITPSPTIYIKKSIPRAPETTLTGNNTITFTGNTTASANTINYNVNPVLNITDSGSTLWRDFEDVKEYSLDGGLSWVTFNTAKSGWTTLNGNILTINNGSWDLRVRYKDRAGNEGLQTRQLIHVNKDFPKLVSITAVQPNSTYKQGDKLEFHLEFAEAVKTNDDNNARITLTNRVDISPNNTAGSVAPSNEVVLTAIPQTSDNITTIKFEWTLNGKEMPDGLYVSKIEFAGTGDGHTGALQDRFGNFGVDSTDATTALITMPTSSSTYTCPNLNGAGLIVDCITPKLDAATPYAPEIGGVSTDNRTVKITFNEPVMIGTGKITVRPYGSYKIPAVMENNGSTVNGTYVAGFYDIYNSSLITNADRQTLTLSTNANSPSMGNLALDERTGQSAGPYVKLTHGLKQGAGFTGNYDNNPKTLGGTSVATGPNGPVPSGTTYLIPDTSTKWVLDYRYSIDNNDNTQYANTSNALTTPSASTVPNIRAVLTKAHWRWQEMELVSSVSLSPDEKTVIIALNEPLLEGLQWGLSFPEGAFTDKAGNKAAAVGTYSGSNVDTTTNSPYWFWSTGVQAPVIRVNRKSYDARTAAWESPTGRNYSPPGDLGGPGGWGIDDFNTVHYRIESETPGAELLSATEIGEESTGGSINIPNDWTGAVTSGSTRTWDNPTQVNGTNTASSGDWVLPNLVRRAGNGAARSYDVTENGFTTTRTITANYAGYRSYNRDIEKSVLDGKGLTTFTGPAGQGQGAFTYQPRQASKNYVVAQARITHSGGTTYNSTKSYEGVFRSVVALKQDTFGGTLSAANRNTNPIMVQGSNVKNGMPSISGFPVYDAGETGDNRFVKLFHYESFGGTVTAMTNGRLYWVSTEIISQWYFMACGYQANPNNNTNGSHMQQGDVNNYMYSGYGDLSYARNMQ